MSIYKQNQYLIQFSITVTKAFNGTFLIQPNDITTPQVSQSDIIRHLTILCHEVILNRIQNRSR